MESPKSPVLGPLSKKRIDYYPLIAIFLFWVTSALGPSFLVARPYITILGVVTIPALVCIFLAARMIYRQHREKS